MQCQQNLNMNQAANRITPDQAARLYISRYFLKQDMEDIQINLLVYCGVSYTPEEIVKVSKDIRLNRIIKSSK